MLRRNMRTNLEGASSREIEAIFSEIRQLVRSDKEQLIKALLRLDLHTRLVRFSLSLLENITGVYAYFVAWASTQQSRIGLNVISVFEV